MFIMSILSRTINEVDKQSAKKKQTMYDLEKTIREMAKSKGMQPRNFLIKACEMSNKLAKNPVIKALIGEYDVPTQKGRDAKPEVLTKRAMNTVKKSIKHSANKQRRRDSKSAITKGVDESGILYRAGVKKYGKAGMKAIQSAAGKGASHQEIGKIKDKHLKDDEAIEEGLKDWAKQTAMAGVIVAGLAGIGSISDAIDNSIPAISAMETALEMAEKSGNDELAKMIEKDLSDAKIRLSSGKDLSHVTDLQNKYAKFIKTEGLAYESKLAVSLNQRLK